MYMRIVNLPNFLNLYSNALLNPISEKKRILYLAVSVYQETYNIPFDEVITLGVYKNVDKESCTKIGQLKW